MWKLVRGIPSDQARHGMLAGVAERLSCNRLCCKLNKRLLLLLGEQTTAAVHVAHLGQMVQHDLSIACDHGRGSRVTLPLAHGGKELVPCLGGRNEDRSLQVLGIEDVLEHWVQGQVGVLACNQVQSCLTVLRLASWRRAASLGVTFAILCICCYEATCGEYTTGRVTEQRKQVKRDEAIQSAGEISRIG